jgi:hypothetical protein
MYTLFPEELEPPAGLINTRLILKVLPVWAALVVIALVVAPLLFIHKIGYVALVISALGIGVGYVIGKAAKDDPDFAPAWIGEFQLDDWYE